MAPRYSYNPALEEDPDFLKVKDQLGANVIWEGEEEDPSLYDFTSPSAAPVVETPMPSSLGVAPQEVPGASASTGYLDELVKKRLLAEEEANKESSLTGNQATSIGLTALLPTILGAIWAKKKGYGGLQGAAAGAEAGGVGALTGLKGFQADNERERKLAATRSTLYGQMEKDERKNMFASRKQEDQQTFNAEQKGLDRDAAMDRALLIRKQLGGQFTSEMAGAIEAFASGKATEEQGKMVLANRDAASAALRYRGLLNEEAREGRLSSKWKNLIGSTTTNPGVEPWGDAKPTPEQAAKAQKIEPQLSMAVRSLNNLKTGLERGMPTSELQAYKANAIIALKTLWQMGANFTFMEKDLIDMQLPQRMAFNDADFMKYIQRGFSRFDDPGTMEIMIYNVTAEGLSKMRSEGASKPRWVSQEDAEQYMSMAPLAQLGKGGITALNKSAFGRTSPPTTPRPRREDFSGDTSAFITATQEWLEQTKK